MAKLPRQSGDMTPLARLIVETMELRGLDDAAVKERSGIPHATLNTLRRRTEPYKQIPREKTLRDLAVGLDLPLSVVEKAARESLGHVYREESGGDVIDLTSLRQLTGAERAKAVRDYKKILDGIVKEP